MKKRLYPKTVRAKDTSPVITEKLDGSNLGLFKLNGELIIAQRNNVFKLSELNKTNSYKGLLGWIEDNKDTIDFCEGSGVFGEWIGMGKLGYGDSLSKKFYIFAKANIDDNLDIRNLNYDTKLFIYPFENQEIPNCMSVVPIVKNLPDNGVDIVSLNLLYSSYLKEVNRPCEGFIINNGNQITKYVRHKNGKLTNHKS